jgi:hypothetical protein
VADPSQAQRRRTQRSHADGSRVQCRPAQRAGSRFARAASQPGLQVQGRAGQQVRGQTGRRVLWRAGRRAGGAGERGALTLSYVIIVPVFLTALLFIAQFALWYLARETALAAARQGTDAARQFSASRQAGPVSAVAFARRHGSGFLLFPAASAAGSGQATVQITVTGLAPSLVPGLTVRVREVARAPVERFTTP